MEKEKSNNLCFLTSLSLAILKKTTFFNISTITVSKYYINNKSYISKIYIKKSYINKPYTDKFHISKLYTNKSYTSKFYIIKFYISKSHIKWKTELTF